MEAEAEVEDVVLREDGVVEATTLPENFHSAVNAFEGAGALEMAWDIPDVGCL